METQGEYTTETYQPAMQSPDIGKLAEALSKAQGEMEGAKKDAKNPFFKSDYATLHSVWAACREHLSKNNLSVIQTTEGNGELTVVTTLAHSSGQWVKGKLSIKPPKVDPQALGSCITYLRRYALAAMVGLSPADDDGEAAMTRPDAGKMKKETPPPKKQVDMKAFITAVGKLVKDKEMPDEIYQAFLADAEIKDIKELTTRENQTAFYEKLKAA